MNVHAKIKSSAASRSEAPRRLFTSADVLAMVRAGILADDERVELIDGELFNMAAKTPRHDDVKTAVTEYLNDNRAGQYRVAPESAFRLSELAEPEPDIFLFPVGLRPSEARGDTALLVVEIAVTSLSIDLEIKAPMYARHGVREYWVIDAKRLITHVHRDPRDEGYASVREAAANEALVPLLLPALSLRLADLGFEPLTDEEVEGG